MKEIRRFLYVVFAVATAMVGYQIHGSVFYSILNFLFAPISWIVWLIGHDVNMTIIKHTFSFFMN